MFGSNQKCCLFVINSNAGLSDLQITSFRNRYPVAITQVLGLGFNFRVNEKNDTLMMCTYLQLTSTVVFTGLLYKTSIMCLQC